MQIPIDWIGHSSRKYQGEPDTFFGWYRTPDGTAVVVKRINPAAHPHAELVAAHEADMLRSMANSGLAVPRLLQQDGTSLHIEFAGYSVKWLIEQCATPPTSGELAVLFQHLCRRGKEFADAEILHLDVWPANLVVPMEHGPGGGHLCLDRPIYIDCSNTLGAGTNLTRPLWINRRMPHIPPEVAALLAADQAAMVATFRAQDFELRDLSATSQHDFHRLGALYRAYSVPQQLQDAVEFGEIDLDAALQFSLGISLQQCLIERKARLPEQSDDLLNQLSVVASRMTAAEPSDRYPTLGDAASAFAELCPGASIRGTAPLPPVRPEDVIYCAAPGSDPPATQTNPWISDIDTDMDDTPAATCPPFDSFQPEPRKLTKRHSFALAAIAATLLTTLFVGGYRENENPSDGYRMAEMQQVKTLRKQIKSNASNYAEAIRTLYSHATDKQHTNPAASRLAQHFIDEELGNLRSRLTAGLMRDSLSSRLLDHDSKAMREWRELRPRLAALANIGNADAKRWLDYCDWAANSTAKTAAKHDVRLSLLH